jgi:hypothetical protein
MSSTNGNQPQLSVCQLFHHVFLLAQAIAR